MPAPTAQVTIRFTGGPSFGTTLVLGDAISPLGTGVLGTSANAPVDFTAQCTQATIRRGRTRVLDKFEASVATFVLVDQTGVLDPQNGTYAGSILPNRQVRISATYGGTERYLFSGFTDSWTYQYPKGTNGLATVTVTAVDATVIARQNRFGFGERIVSVTIVAHPVLADLPIGAFIVCVAARIPSIRIAWVAHLIVIFRIVESP